MPRTIAVLVMMLSGCQTGECMAELEASRVTCSRFDDPVPETADDESTTVVVVELAPGSFDGTERTIHAEVDSVALDPIREHTIDETRRLGVTALEDHDAAIVDVWVEMHGYVSYPMYDRTTISGTVRADPDGHGAASILVGGRGIQAPF